MSGTDPTAPVAARALGFWMCTALVVGNIIGVGIFVMPASLAPYGLNAVTGWLVTVVGCVFIALTFAALARAYPGDDGPYQYTQRAFGPAIAFLVMWCYWISVPVANAAIAIGTVGYLGTFIPALAHSPASAALTAVALVWLFVVINLRGARSAGWVQLVTTGLKLLPQLAVILLGLALLVTHPAAYTEHVPATAPSWSAVSSVSTLALFAMLGIECAAIPAGRVFDPQRTIPRATLAGTVIAAAIYCAVSIVPMLLIPQTELAASNAPFADLFSRELGGQYGKLLAACIIVSALGALNGWTLIMGELTQTLARHDGFPRSLGAENARGAPSRALAVSGFVTSMAILTNYTDSVGTAFALLTVIATATNLPLYFACALGVIVLRRRGLVAPNGRPLLMVLVGLLATAYCIWVSSGVGAKPLLWTLALGGSGIPVYLWSLRARRHAVLADGIT